MTPTAGAQLRPLAPGDVAILQEIDRVAHGTAWSQRAFLDEIEQADRVHLTLSDGAELVGHASAWIDGSSGRITNVAVRSDRSGRGHATTLLHGLISNVLNEHRVNNLQLEVRAANRRAQRLYSRFGFQPVGVERDFYDRADSTGSRDAVVMAVADVHAEPWRDRLGRLASPADDEEAA